MNGTDLLAEFRKTRSEEAFRELVRRYTNLVFSVAKRRLANISLAQEVTQIVFIRLASSAPKIRGDAELVAWLHRTTVHASIDLWRAESRRQAREENAAAMQPESHENIVWKEIAPVLDEALNELGDADRQAILLRFFNQKTMRDVGDACGVSEDAAKMRVSRALERLRRLFTKRGVTCSAVALAALLADLSVEAAPGALVATLANMSIPVSAGVGIAGLSALVLSVARIKMAMAVVAVVLVAVVAVVWVRSKRGTQSGASSIGQTTLANDSIVPGRTAPDSNIPGIAGEQGQAAPDPIKLLQGIAHARQRITSGEMEMELATFDLDRPEAGTNHVHVKLVFGDGGRRFDSLGCEYSYVSMEPKEIEAAEARMKTESLDKEAAVRAGLLKGFDSHHVTAYDGAQLMDYWENDGVPLRTDIRDPREGSAQYIFDPRCLGISISPGLSDTVANCLPHQKGVSVQLLRSETIEGINTWHVQTRRGDENADFWIETANPSRVIAFGWNGSTVISRYDEANPSDPIPVDLREQFRHGTTGKGTAFTARHWVRKAARLNIPVDPDYATLAGLGMKIGTDVSDNRIHRRIGYWTGSGLSDDLPSKTTPTQTAPDRAELAELMQRDPSSKAAFDAAQWVLLNTQDGPEVETARDLILQEHIGSTNLVHLAQELERMRHPSCRELLEAMVEKNPDSAVRGNACLTLAIIRKDAADYGNNKPATVEAEKLFQQVISDFGTVKKNGSSLADLARPELSEIRGLFIGKSAPETTGLNLEGQPMRLSVYRGKVVVLIFWGACGGCRPDVKGLRELTEQFVKKPFAVLGVYCDDDAARGKEIAEKMEILWPSFHGGRIGPIPTAWNNHSWPSIFVLDRKGTIRFRGYRQSDLVKIVETLLAE